MTDLATVGQAGRAPSRLALQDTEDGDYTGRVSMSRNFSRPQHGRAQHSYDDASSQHFSFDAIDDSPAYSRPPSLSFSNSRDSDGNVDSPTTPYKPVAPPLMAKAATSHGWTREGPEERIKSSWVSMDANPEEEHQSQHASSGFAKKLRHVASTSHLGRTLTKSTGKGAKPGASTPLPAPRKESEESFFPDWSSARPSQDLLGGREAFHADAEAASRWNGDLTQRPEKGKKVRGAFWKELFAPKEAQDEAWDLKREPTSQRSPPVVPEGLPIAWPDAPHRPVRVPSSAGSKADRILGIDEHARPEQRRWNSGRQARPQDVLAEFTYPARKTPVQSSVASSAPEHGQQQTQMVEKPLPPIVDQEARTAAQSTHSKHRPSDSVCSYESCATTHSADSSGSSSHDKVSEAAPQLGGEIGLPYRELSDDIEAILRSSRSSVQNLEDVLAAHRQISQRRSSMSHHRKTSSTSSSRSSRSGRSALALAAATGAARQQSSRHNTPGHSPSNSMSSTRDSPGPSPLTFPSPPKIGARKSSHHLPRSSISSQSSLTSSATESSQASSQASSRETPSSDASLNRTSLASIEEKLSGLDVSAKPVRPGMGRARTANVVPNATTLRLPGSGLTSRGMERVHSAPMQALSFPDEGAGAAANVTVHPFAAASFSPTRPPLRTAQTSGAEVSLRAANVSHNQPPALKQKSQVSTMLGALPPLSSLLDACLIASQAPGKSPWQVTTHRPASTSSSQDRIPSSWNDFIRAYAAGDIDLSSPPQPREALMAVHAAADPPLFEHARMASGESEALDAFPSSSGIGLDFTFPMPPTRSRRDSERADDHGHTGRNTDSLGRTEDVMEAAASGSSLLAEADGLAQEDDLAKAQETATIGGLGDFKAPRPPFEAARQLATSVCLESLDFASGPASSYHNANLLAIVERLASLLGAAEASIRLVSNDELITLARTGHTIGSAYEDVMRTPRASEGGNEHWLDHSALGVSLFDTGHQRGSSTTALRNDSLDGHAILSRQGAPVILNDVQGDWRFSHRRNHGGVSFYAGASILSEDGLPIGTVSVGDVMSRPSGLDKEGKALLAQAARDVATELRHRRKASLAKRLAMLDESLWSWCEDDKHHTPSATLGQSMASIERTLLPVPEAAALRSHAPPSPNSLAHRRGAKVPPSLTVVTPGLDKAAGQHPRQSVIQNALRTIVSALQMDLAYIVKVSSVGTTEGGDRIKSSIVAQHDESSMSLTTIQPDGPLHLCALAATKRGLHFQQDPARVAQLFGHEDGASQASSGQGSSGAFHTAAAVNCGLQEGGRTWRGTQGWVLCVATRSKTVRLAPESIIYLLRFGTLLAPIMLEDSAKSPSSASFEDRLGNLTSPALPPHLTRRARSSSSPRPLTSLSPTNSLSSGGRDSPSMSRPPSSRSARCMSPSVRRNIPPPLMSPPPNEPLPMLPSTPSPVTMARQLSRDRSASIGQAKNQYSPNHTRV
ncbi:unnamed protein product [Jaminaea pallidilutea]